MSFAEKITGLMANQSGTPGPTDDQPWYLKYGVKVVGLAGAFFCILFGVFTTLGIILLDVGCLVGGIIEVVVGFVIMMLEAPFCFFCIEHVGKIAMMVDARPMWNRAAVYCVIAIFPLFFCRGLGTIFPCALVFICGVMYGMMSLGKKASAEQMRQAAVNSGLAGTTPQPTTNDRAGIINNAQPFSFTGAVGTDSNV